MIILYYEPKKKKRKERFSFTKILYILIHGYKILKKISYF